MAVWLMAGTLEAFASGEAYGLGYETIGQAAQALKYAAIQSPQWHYRRDAIERDVSDIAFLLEQAWRARQRFDEEVMREYAQRALHLLRRAMLTGAFYSGACRAGPHRDSAVPAERVGLRRQGKGAC